MGTLRGKVLPSAGNMSSLIRARGGNSYYKFCILYKGGWYRYNVVCTGGRYVWLYVQFTGLYICMFHLHQARPITTLDEFTEEDLIHEFDDPLITDKEWLTTGNIR